jgi:hypothetical protein
LEAVPDIRNVVARLDEAASNTRASEDLAEVLADLGRSPNHFKGAIGELAQLARFGDDVKAIRPDVGDGKQFRDALVRYKDRDTFLEVKNYKASLATSRSYVRKQAIKQSESHIRRSFGPGGQMSDTAPDLAGLTAVLVRTKVPDQAAETMWKDEWALAFQDALTTLWKPAGIDPTQKKRLINDWLESSLDVERY